MEFREGQLLKFSRGDLPPREVAQVEQVDRGEALEGEEVGPVVAVWLSSPYQQTEPQRLTVEELVQVEELAELPAMKPKKKRPEAPAEVIEAAPEEAPAEG